MGSGRSMDERFGELRSLAHSAEAVDAGVWRELLVDVRGADPELYDARWLPYLSRVALPTFKIGPDDAWNELFACLPTGVSVRLMGGWSGGHDLEKFSVSQGAAKIARLDLSGLEMGDLGLHHFLREERFRRLNALDLRKNGITEASIKVFVRTRWSELERLVLCDNTMGDGALTLLAQSLDAPKLAWLDVSRNPYGQIGAAELRQSPRLERVFVVT